MLLLPAQGCKSSSGITLHDLTNKVEEIKSLEAQRSKVQAVEEWQKWTEYTLGILVGAGVELATNVENQCVVSVANLIESSYLIYYYVYNYITTSEEDDVAWATTYSIKLVRGLLEINCV